jgi:hypothetical protein
MRTPLVSLLLACFILSSVLGPFPQAMADEFYLPAPGIMVHLSPQLDPPVLKGIKVHPDNPFQFDFILDKGDMSMSSPNAAVRGQELKQEATKLIKYFLASLTIPENDLWVNLSPYEKERIIPNSFGFTEMGRDLLAEDYMLKQITASLIYPEDAVGRRFWKRIYEQAAGRFGTTNIPVNTFNKVWIVPEKAVVFENAKAGTAYVVESKLKVMLEQDYLALSHNVIPAKMGIQNKRDINALGSQIVREIVIPELNREVNENKNFAKLRQVYNSLILATWYKKKIKDSILAEVYADKNKTAGINIDDPQEKRKIYERYLRAFKKGVYNYIKEEIDPITQEMIPRKYFSGGEALFGIGEKLKVDYNQGDVANLQPDGDFEVKARIDGVRENQKPADHAMSNAQILSNPIPISRNRVSEVENQQVVDDLVLAMAITGHHAPIKFGIDINWLETIGESLSPLDHSINLKQLAKMKEGYVLLSGKIIALEKEHPSVSINAEEIRTGYLQWLNEFKDSLSHILESWKNNPGIDVFFGGAEQAGALRKRLGITLNIYVPALEVLLSGDALTEDHVVDLNHFLTSVEWDTSGGRVPVKVNGTQEQVFAKVDANLLQMAIGRLGTENFTDSIIRKGFNKGSIPDELWNVSITLEHHAIRKSAVIIIRNPGTIPADKLGKLFILDHQREAFFTGGVGSSFAARVIRKMGGDISFRNFTDAKSGTPMVEFTITFPQADHAGVHFHSEAEARERGLNSEKLNGGIDLTAHKTPLEIKNSGESIKFHLDPAMLQQLQNAPGFVPVIISVQPLKSLSGFLGLNQETVNNS